MAIVPRSGSWRPETTEERRDTGARAVFGAIRDRELDARQRIPVEVKADPDKASRARKASLFLGVSPDVIERRMPEIEAEQRARAVAQAADQSTAFRQWINRPNMLRVSHDDADALVEVARPFEPDAITRQVQREARQRERANKAADGFFDQASAFFSRGGALFEGGLFTVGAALQEWSASVDIPFYSDEVNARNREESLAIARQLRARAQASMSGGEIRGEVTWEKVKERPSAGNVASFVAQQGVQSLPSMAAAAISWPVLAVSQSGTIGQDRARNDGREYASINDVLAAAPAATASALLDRVGVEAIFAAPGKSVFRRVAGAAAGEGLTEFVQGGIEYAGGSIGTTAGFNWRDAIDQSVAGAVAGAGMGGTIRVAQETVQTGATRAVEFVQARAGARLVGDIFAKAEGSKLRLRDPELFAEFLQQQAGGTAAENLYVPATVLQSLYQSERGDDAVRFEDFVPNFWDQLETASASGGDVVIPMAKAAAYLAGTPEWDMLKDEARLTPGGMSPSEARSLEEDWSDVVEALGRRAEEAAAREVEEQAPRARVYSAVLSQAREAGFSLNASRAYADLWAERYQARAERLGDGRDAFALFEASVAGIKQALPETVETYRRGTGLDVLINAMRERAQPMRPEGKTLLDRIIEGGGVIDAGGDIRSMGGDRVQRGGYFGRRRMPLLRDRDETGDMLGGGSNADYGLDTWALRLWEEGYFPEFQDRPSVNDLIDAIGESLRGRDIYPQGAASPAVEANNEIVTAADDLRTLLFAAGLDPDTASREEIERAIAAYDAETGEFGFDQIGAPNSEAFERWSGGAPVVRAGEAEAYNFQDGQPVVVEAFHGTARPDRIGEAFLAERATAGPMAYFTSSPALASSYAEGKQDTSINDDDFDYANWFKIKLPGQAEPVPLLEAWDKLPALTRSRARQLAPRVRLDEDTAENIELGPEGETRGVGSYDYEIKQSRGNVAKALVESWLASGALFNQEHRFLDVLRLIGIPTADVIYDNPHATYPSVFHVWVAMRKPLVAGQVPAEVEAALDAAAAAEPERGGSVYDNLSNNWDKRAWSVREWVEQYNRPEDRPYVWTRIPDGVTEVFRSFGYDGIIDYSGKGGGSEIAPVYIPFGEPQVKAFHNRGAFDPSDRRMLYQRDQDRARGRIDFLADKRATITLFEGRDLSTLLHEGGHLWLEELRADALALTSPAVFADWETIKAWMRKETGLEIADDQPIPTEAHELWARGMERYFMEGKAPSQALQGAFASFRAWLLRIYQLVTRLNSNIDDEVRGVFDRLLATDQAISFAQEESVDRALFADAAGAGMTEEEFSAYSKLVEESRTEAFDALIYRTMETVRRARTVEHRERRARLRLEVETEIKARPEWVAIDLMRGTGEDYMPVDRRGTVERVGNDAWPMLPHGRPGRPTFVEGGADPDLVAERAGFDSGTQMLEALMGIGMRRKQLSAAGDKRTVLDEAIDVETDRRMAERYGDILADGSIEEEALEIIRTDAGAQRLAAEVRQLAKQTGEAPAPVDVIRDWAERIVREGRVVDHASAAAVDRHARAERKAARAAEAAYLAGDMETAFREKQKQQIANALFRASRDAKNNVDVIARRLDRLGRSRGLKGMDPEYLDRIHELLERYDLRRRSEKLLRERESFDRWAQRQREEGYEVFVPERLTLGGQENFTRLAYGDLVALDDAVQSLAHLGRAKKRMLVEQEERDFDAMVGQAEQTAQALPVRKWHADRNEKPNRMRDASAMLEKVEFLADYLDNGDPNGVFNQVLVKGATEAANTKERLEREVLDPLARMYLDLPARQRRRFAERIVVPEFVSIHPETHEALPTTFMRSELIAMALNVGNKSNLEKMLIGETLALPELLRDRHGWTEEKVMAVLGRHLDEADWAFVESVWRQLDTLWPDIVKAEREITGITPEKIEGRPVDTPYGTIEGGYYPVVYDPNRSARAADNVDDDAKRLFGQIGRIVATPKGHTITRTSAAMPITLSLERVLFNHVQRVTTRIAYGRYVRDTLKFISNDRVRRIINEHLGLEYHKQLKPWLQRQINEAAMDTKHLSALDRILRQFRVNATLVGMGFRATTMITQVAGWNNSAAEIGAGWLLRGMRETVANMGSIRDMVFEKSPEMASRAQAFDRDVATFYADAMSGGRIEDRTWMGKLSRAAAAAGLPKLQGAAFWGIGMIDVYLVAMPTWVGAYRKGLDQGMSDAEAAAFGDKAVRKSQSAGRAKDLSALQGGPEAVRVLTMFYSYFNVLYNKQIETFRDARRGHWRQAAMNVWWIMLAAPLVSALLVGDIPEEEERDPEGWTAWALNRIFFGLWAGVPGLRDVTARWSRKLEGKYVGGLQSPIFDAFEALERPIGDAWKVLQGDDPSDRWVRNAIEAPGYFIGLPTGQVGATTQYLVDVAEGDQEPEGVGDVALGLAKGPQKDQE